MSNFVADANAGKTNTIAQPLPPSTLTKGTTTKEKQKALSPLSKKTRKRKTSNTNATSSNQQQSINVGPGYQAEIPPLISDIELITKQLPLTTFDSECLWRPDENQVNSEFLKEYCNVAQLHQGLSIDEVFLLSILLSEFIFYAH